MRGLAYSNHVTLDVCEEKKKSLALTNKSLDQTTIFSFFSEVNL